MSRSCTLNPGLLEELSERKKEGEDFPQDPFADDGTDPTGGYLTMRSYPVNLPGQNPNEREGENLAEVFSVVGMHREVASSYVTVRPRIQSAPGETNYLIDNDMPHLQDPLLPISKSSTATAHSDVPTVFPSQYSFATATMNGRDKAKTALAESSSSNEEAIIPTSVRFLYQRPTPISTATASADSSTASVRPDIGDPLAPSIPSRLDHGRDQLSHDAATPPSRQRGKHKSESDAGGGSVQPPAVPPRLHAHQQQQYIAESEKNHQTTKPMKPPKPPPRRKTNPGAQDTVLFSPPKPVPSPRLSGSHGSSSHDSGSHGADGSGSHDNGGGTPIPNKVQMKMQTLILSDPEFQSCTHEVCLKALRKCNFEMNAAKEEVRVHMLMEMRVAHITADDCRRALSHCQQKTDRAAAWLLEQSDEIERQRQ